MAQLIQKPHMLRSVRARTWHLPGAINEFVDNSFGHGNAETVEIVIGGEEIRVADDGIGVDDVNRLFRLGDASAYTRPGEIGQYGVGAKNAMLWLGDHVEVTTVRDSRRHEMVVNWREC